MVGKVVWSEGVMSDGTQGDRIAELLDDTAALRADNDWLRRQLHETIRTRSEAEAAAELKGYRAGAESVIKQLRAYELKITVGSPS